MEIYLYAIYAQKAIQNVPLILSFCVKADLLQVWRVIDMPGKLIGGNEGAG